MNDYSGFARRIAVIHYRGERRQEPRFILPLNFLIVMGVGAVLLWGSPWLCNNESYQLSQAGLQQCLSTAWQSQLMGLGFYLIALAYNLLWGAYTLLVLTHRLHPNSRF